MVDFSAISSSRILIAISGGLDSVVLAHLAQSTGVSYALAHVNYGLRGKESDLDEQLVRELAAEWNVPCFVHQAKDEISIAANIQSTAREIRYRFFEQVMQAESYDILLTAHHANDQAETLLINQLRGTGISGLKGILYQRGKILRPLLLQSKAALHAYAVKHQLRWREDASNQTDDYLRNLIRHHLIPAIERIQPNAVQTFANNAWFIGQQLHLVQELLDKTLPDWMELDGVFEMQIAPFASLKQAEMALFMRLRQFQFDLETCQKILASTDKSKSFRSSTHEAIKVEGTLKVVSLSRGKPSSFELESLRTFAWGNRFFSFEKPSATDRFGINLNTLKFPLTVRPWKAGDKFKPVGLGGTKKVADLLTDLKFDLFQKEQVFVLCSGGDIVSVSDLRISEAFACDATEPQALRIRINTL